MKVALAHDYLVDADGAERIVEVFHELYLEAPVYPRSIIKRLPSPASGR